MALVAQRAALLSRLGEIAAIGLRSTVAQAAGNPATSADISVIYRGSRYEQDLPLDLVAQSRVLEWELTFKTSGDISKLLALIDSVRLLLQGFRLPDCQPGLIARDGLIGWDDTRKTPIYVLIFTARSIEVQQCLEPGQVNEQITFRDGVAYTSVQAIGDVAVLRLDLNPYVGGVDFLVDAVSGMIIRIDTGAIPDGATVLVSYTWPVLAVRLTFTDDYGGAVVPQEAV